MSVLKIKDENGNWTGIQTIQGDKGEPGDSASHAYRHRMGGADEIHPIDIGAAERDHTHRPEDVGAASAEELEAIRANALQKTGGTVNGNLNVNGAFVVERSDNNRKARTVVHNNDDKEADFQNYTDDSNYVGIRVATESKGAGDAAKVVHMKNGQFASFPILHTGNKEKIFTFGAEDLTAGTSPLGTGQLHFVYE